MPFQLQDGLTFSIFDGRSTVEFEFDLVESNTGVTPGRVQIPYTLQYEVPGTEDINPVTGLPIPGTGTVRPETAPEVAFSIIDAINRSDVQSVINVRALPGGGVDAVTDPTINLFGDVVVIDENGALESVDLGIRRGDTNRDRDSQGVILVENSRFLYQPRLWRRHLARRHDQHRWNGCAIGGSISAEPGRTEQRKLEAWRGCPKQRVCL